MSNPYSDGGHYTQPYLPNPMFNRRSSYASVAAGTASTNNTTSNDPNLPQVRQPSRGGMDVDDRPGASGSPLWRKSAIMYDESGGMSSFGDVRRLGGFGTMEQETPPFFTPSYLRGSRYVQRLEEAHKARLRALRDARQNNTYSAPGTGSANSSSINLPKLGGTGGFRGPMQDAIERAPPVDMEEGLRPLPSKWSEEDKCFGLDIVGDGTEVKFQGVTKTSDEAAAVRADCPMPKECGIYYFEVTVLSRGKEGLIGIGFSGPKVSLNRLPGWEAESWAYHGDDGFSFACTASGRPYGPRFAAMDVVGCGVNFETNSAFFTKNGIYLGEAFQNIKTDRLYPSVGMKKPGEHLRINFGQSPFVFDIDSMVENKKAELAQRINKTSTASIFPDFDESSLMQELVAQYLAHDGYVETVKTFAEEVQEQRTRLGGSTGSLSMFDPSENAEAINRQKIRASILEGDIDKALKYIDTFYPHVLTREENRDIYFKLRCRKFIEMMRRINGKNNSIADSTATLQPSQHRPQDVAGMKGDVNAAFQMELDDQINRESRPPTAPLSPTAAFADTPASTGAAADDEDDTMDETPDVKPDTSGSDDATVTSGGKSSVMEAATLLNDAIAYGAELKAEFSEPRFQKPLVDTWALIAYGKGSKMPLAVAALMMEKWRTEIAEGVNGAVMRSLGKPPSAALEKMVAQTGVLMDMLVAEKGGEYAFINVGEEWGSWDEN